MNETDKLVLEIMTSKWQNLKIKELKIKKITMRHA